VLGELEKAELVGMTGQEKESDKKSFGSLGFSVENLNATLAEALGLDNTLQGVVVTEVIASSPAAQKGLEPGDIIRRFGQRQVEDAASFADAVAKAKESGRSGILVLVEREGNQRFVQIGFADAE
jgi:serine protease Do